MIKHDEHKISSIYYLKELLEGKYIKRVGDNNFTILFIKEIREVYLNNDIEWEMGFISYTLNRNNEYTHFNSLENEILMIRLDDDFFNLYSFTTKKDFLSSCDEFMKEITKGTKK